MKILTVVGARPNFVKIAPLAKELSRRKIDYDLIHTGQHYDEALSKSFFDQLNIPKPTLYLGVGSGTHGVQTGKMMMKLEEVLMQGDYDLVMVVGDVNSTLAAALAAVKLHIPVAHIESGYRSFDMRMPEEINRVLVDRVSQILFAPTETAVLNLINEGIPRNRIFLVGNIMIETLANNMDRIDAATVESIPDEYVVLTAHRAENTNDKEVLSSILQGVQASALPVVFPVHPRTQEKLKEYGMWDALQQSERLHIIEPLSYLPFQKLIKGAKAVLTDSGGVQEEALIYNVPCITLRKNTERMITLQLGANTLVGTDSDKIRSALDACLKEKEHAWPAPAYWDNGVSARIVDTILRHKELLSVPSSDQR